MKYQTYFQDIFILHFDFFLFTFKYNVFKNNILCFNGIIMVPTPSGLRTVEIVWAGKIKR